MSETKFTPGDYWQYNAGSWCVHGIALVESDGTAWDTYRGRFSSLDGPVNLRNYPDAKFLGNLNDFTGGIPYPYTYWDFADKDQLFIPIGGGSELRMIRKVSEPIYAMALSRLEADKRSAEYKVESLQRQINEVQAKTQGAS